MQNLITPCYVMTEKIKGLWLIKQFMSLNSLHFWWLNFICTVLIIRTENATEFCKSYKALIPVIGAILVIREIILYLFKHSEWVKIATLWDFHNFLDNKYQIMCGKLQRNHNSLFKLTAVDWMCITKGSIPYLFW